MITTNVICTTGNPEYYTVLNESFTYYDDRREVICGVTRPRWDSDPATAHCPQWSYVCAITPRVLGSYTTDVVFKQLELKDSVNSLGLPAEVRGSLTWKLLQPKRNWKRPKVFVSPLFLDPFDRKVPELKVYTIEMFVITPPAKATQNWYKFKLPRLEVARTRRVNALNQKAVLKYQRRMAVYNAAKAKFETRREAFLKHHALALAKSRQRQIAYESYLKRLKDAEYRRLTKVKYDEFHPYRRLNLINLGSVPQRLTTKYKWRKYNLENCPYNYLSESRHGWFNYSENTLPNYSNESESDRNELVENVYSRIQALAEDLVVDIEAKAVKKLYSKIARNKVHMGNLLAERHQTREMLIKTALRLMTLVKAKRRLFGGIKSVFSNPREKSKMLANWVLEYKFGWEPLIKDLHTAIESFTTDDIKLTFISRNMRPMTGTKDGITFEGFVRLHYVARFQVQSDAAVALQQWGLINPLQIAWEVTPWSFVVDWFLPFGSYLEALTAEVGLINPEVIRKVGLNGTFKFSDPFENGAVPEAISATGSYHTTFEEASFAGMWSSRKVSNTLPEANLILGFKDPTSLWHSAESLSLLLQRFKGLR